MHFLDLESNQGLAESSRESWSSWSALVSGKQGLCPVNWPSEL